MRILLVVCFVFSGMVFARSVATPKAVLAFENFLRSGNAVAFKFWLQQGETPPIDTVLNEDGHRFLHSVAVMGRGEFADILLDEGADVEEPDTYRLTPIDYAEVWQEFDVMARLLAAGATRIAAIELEPEGTLSRAFQHRREESFAELELDIRLHIYRSNVPRVNCLTVTCSLFMEWLGQVPVFSSWEHIADAQYNFRGRTQLQEAVIQRKIRLMKLLFLTQTARLEKKDQNGWRAVHYAAFLGHLPELELLYAEGADINALTDGTSYSPLSLAALMGHTQVMQRLLQMGADHALTDHRGMDALQSAVVAGRKETVQTLIVWGASIDSVNAEGKTVRDIAADRDDAELVDLIAVMPELRFR